MSTSTLFPTLVGNLLQVVRYVEEAVKESVDIVLFPEYFLEDILNEDRQYLSLPSSHLESFLVRLAKEHGVGIGGTIVHGRIRSSKISNPPTIDPFKHLPLRSNSNTTKLIDDAEAEGEWLEYLKTNRDIMLNEISQEHLALENEAFLIGKDGEVLGRYVKRNLWHPEREYLSPGKDSGEVFDTPWGKIGFLICWDLSHPAAAQNLVDKGADIILMPTYWLATDSEPMLSKYNKDLKYEFKIIQSLALARAFETETFLFMVNAGGPRDQGFMGGSGAWAPLLGQIDGFDEPDVGVKVVEVDLDLIKDARETYKIREDWSDKELR